MRESAPSKPAAPPHSGHRERLRARFMKAGDTALADYEMLELVLFRAIPRRDVKPLAKRLIERFSDFGGVISADPARLRRAVLSSWSALMGYCKAKMARLEREEFRILFLDRKNRLIADEAQSTGTVDHVPVYPREVVRRALELNATAIILVHNHPSGDPTPSKADIEMTKTIVEAAKPLGVTVHDHVIIGRDMDASFRSLGLI